MVANPVDKSGSQKSTRKKPGFDPADFASIFTPQYSPDRGVQYKLKPDVFARAIAAAGKVLKDGHAH